jgi:hypothetical protein
MAGICCGQKSFCRSTILSPLFVFFSHPLDQSLDAGIVFYHLRDKVGHLGLDAVGRDEEEGEGGDVPGRLREEINTEQSERGRVAHVEKKHLVFCNEKKKPSNIRYNRKQIIFKKPKLHWRLEFYYM